MHLLRSTSPTSVEGKYLFESTFRVEHHSVRVVYSNPMRKTAIRIALVFRSILPRLTPYFNSAQNLFLVCLVHGDQTATLKLTWEQSIQISRTYRLISRGGVPSREHIRWRIRQGGTTYKVEGEIGVREGVLALEVKRQTKKSIKGVVGVEKTEPHDLTIR